MKRNPDITLKQFFSPGLPVYLAVEITALILLLCADVASPYLYKEFIDRVLLGGEMDRLILICGSMLVLFMARYAVRFLKLRGEIRYEYGVQAGLRSRMFDRFATDSRLGNDGEHLKLYDEYARKMGEAVRRYGIEPLFYTLTVLVMAAVSISINLQLFLMSVFAIALSLAIHHICAEKVHRNSQEYKNIKNENDGWLLSVLKNISGIRGLGCSGELPDRYGEKEREAFQIYARERKILCGITVVQDFNYRFLLEMALYFYGGYLILNGRLNLGTFMAFLSYYKKIYNNVKLLGERRVERRKEAPWFERMTELVCGGTDFAGEKKAYRGNICIKGSFYPYGNAENAFCLSVDGICIEKGKKVAVLGKSGCGKTTFVKLVCEKMGRTECLYAEKEPYFFDLSVMDNLLLIDADREEIKRCVALCFEPEEIRELGLFDADRTIGEGGCRLSGGQRERLNIVRVLLRKPQLAVWDEAMAQMDAEMEKKMYEVISFNMPECTHLFISHKKEILSYVDEIIYVEDGKVEKIKGTNFVKCSQKEKTSGL